MKFSIYIPLALALFFLYGCQEIDEPRKPDVLLSKKQMEAILYESTLLKAARGYNTGLMTRTGIKPDTYIYEKFDIDSTVLAQNMSYYSVQVDWFTALNQRILKRYEKEFLLKDSIYTLERKERDSLNKLNLETGVKTLDTTRILKSRKLKPTKRKVQPIQVAKEITLPIMRDTI